MDTQPTELGQWAIVEIMGRKVVAGYCSQSVRFGLPMLRIDIPATSVLPAFSQEYGAQAIYAITYVSKEVACMTAESAKVNPVSVYVPDLAEMQRAKFENDRLRQEIRNLRALPTPRDDQKLCIRCQRNPVTWPLICDDCQDHETQEELVKRYAQDGENPDDYRCIECGMIWDGGQRCTYCGNPNPTNQDPADGEDDEDPEL